MKALAAEARRGVRGAMMSGSGSTMFAVVEDEGRRPH
ncbi:MAG: hypothetical protein ACLSUW_06190 [Akkermansia sp.]